MNPEPESNKRRRRWVLMLLLVLGAFTTYLVLTYPVAKAVRAARDQQRLNR